MHGKIKQKFSLDFGNENVDYIVQYLNYLKANNKGFNNSLITFLIKSDNIESFAVNDDLIQIAHDHLAQIPPQIEAHNNFQTQAQNGARDLRIAPNLKLFYLFIYLFI